MLAVLFTATSLRARQLNRETSDEFPISGTHKIHVDIAMWVVVGAITALFIVVAGGKLSKTKSSISASAKELAQGGSGSRWVIGIEVLRHICLLTIFGAVIAIVMAINENTDSPFEPGSVNVVSSEGR